MTQAFTILRPLDDGNAWDNRLTCSKSRPKSLDMAREYSVLTGTRTQLKSTPGFFPPLSVFVLKNKQNFTAGSRDSSSLNRNLNGIYTRPLTWGPNGSKFTDAIANLVDFELSATANRKNELITSPRILDDVTNNNVPSKQRKVLRSETESHVKHPYGSNVKKVTGLQKNEALDASVKIVAKSPNADTEENTVSNSSSSLPSRKDKVDKMVEDLLGEMMNEVVRNEAFRKSQALFKANEMRLAQNVGTKYKIKKRKDQKTSTNHENHNVDSTATTDHHEITERNIFDATPNIDEAATELQRRLTCEVFENGSQQTSEVTMSSNVITPKKTISTNCNDGFDQCICTDYLKVNSCIGKSQNNSSFRDFQMSEPLEKNVQQILVDSDFFHQISFSNEFSKGDDSDFEADKEDKRSYLKETDAVNNEISLAVEGSVSVIDPKTYNISCSRLHKSYSPNIADNEVKMAVKDCIETLLQNVESISDQTVLCLSSTDLNILNSTTANQNEQLELLLQGIQETDLLHTTGTQHTSKQETTIHQTQNLEAANHFYPNRISLTVVDSCNSSVSSEDHCEVLDITLTGYSDGQLSSDDSEHETTFVNEYGGVDDFSNDADEEDASETDDLIDVAADQYSGTNSGVEFISKTHKLESTPDPLKTDFISEKTNENEESDQIEHEMQLHQPIDENISSEIAYETLLENLDSISVKQDDLFNTTVAVPENMTFVVDNYRLSTSENKSFERSQSVDNAIDPGKLIDKNIEGNSTTTSNILTNIVTNNAIDLDETRSVESLSSLDLTKQNNYQRNLLISELIEHKPSSTLTNANQLKVLHNEVPAEENIVSHEIDSCSTPKVS